ncbi:MAG: T9SS type A sorting domain-containing protein, partial [Salinivirgaceae bacterium]|nr:T9SS type A sorting domain-containing protein [Salinivirgaceae bacterium]
AKCNATTDKAGTFDIVVSGGEAENYSFEYKNGKLTVNAKENISAIADNEVKISVYPNPTADVFFVETEAEVELIYVYNMTGKLVLTEANVGKTRIDLANEPQGTYFVKVGDKTIKVLKF